jgi:hypothetical protein
MVILSKIFSPILSNDEYYFEEYFINNVKHDYIQPVSAWPGQRENEHCQSPHLIFIFYSSIGTSNRDGWGHNSPG